LFFQTSTVRGPEIAKKSGSFREAPRKRRFKQGASALYALWEFPEKDTPKAAHTSVRVRIIIELHTKARFMTFSFPSKRSVL
jgi:hypothetical protein